MHSSRRGVPGGAKSAITSLRIVGDNNIGNLVVSTPIAKQSNFPAIR